MCCIALHESEKVREFESVCPRESLVLCIASASLLYLKGARTQLLDPRQVGPTMQYKITYCSYIMALQAKEISLLDSPRLLPEPFVHHVLASSCQVGPVVASYTARHVA